LNNLGAAATLPEKLQAQYHKTRAQGMQWLADLKRVAQQLKARGGEPFPQGCGYDCRQEKYNADLDVYK
jgi:hypothetical protein